MKKLPLFIVIMLIYSSNADGQKMMKLDDELKTYSQPMEAKRKGISTVGKYEFGPYKIVSGKAGWTITKSKERFVLVNSFKAPIFNLDYNTESKNKSSFVFIANDKDTLLVNLTTNSKASETYIGPLSWLNQSNENYITMISPVADTSKWVMILNTNSGAKVEGNYTAEGVLTDGVTNIEIREVKQWEDGKSPAFGMICGYEFYVDNHSIAAVQSCLDTTKKKFVWLYPDLDEKIKSVIAAASASLMVHTDEMMASQ